MRTTLLLFLLMPVVGYAQTATEWVYDVSHDVISEKNTPWAAIYSTNEVEFDFPYHGGTKAYLMIKNITSQRRPRYRIFVGITKGQINGSYEDSYNRMGLKFDNDKGFYVNYDLSSDDNSFVELEPGLIYEGVYFGTGRKFVRKLTGVEKMIIQIPVYEEGLVEFYFNIDGLNLKRISGEEPVKRQKDAVYGLSK